MCDCIPSAPHKLSMQHACMRSTLSMYGAHCSSLEQPVGCLKHLQSSNFIDMVAFVLQAPTNRNTVVAAAQAGSGAGAPRFGQTSGPNGFRTLPVVKVPCGPSPNDPSMPLEIQMEVLTPEGGCQAANIGLWSPASHLLAACTSCYRSVS